VIASVVLALPLSDPEGPPEAPPLAAAANAVPNAMAQSGLGSEQKTCWLGNSERSDWGTAGLVLTVAKW
jgi:hypothetical protein